MVSVSRTIRVEEAFEDGVIVARRDVPPVKPACNDAACAASIVSRKKGIAATSLPRG